MCCCAATTSHSQNNPLVTSQLSESVSGQRVSDALPCCFVITDKQIIFKTRSRSLFYPSSTLIRRKTQCIKQSAKCGLQFRRFDSGSQCPVNVSRYGRKPSYITRLHPPAPWECRPLHHEVPVSPWPPPGLFTAWRSPQQYTTTETSASADIR